MILRDVHHILISRVDAIGDVILTLPICGIIKAYYPNCKISFLGRSYTREVVLLSEHVNEFIDYDEWHSISDKDAANFLKLKKIDTIIHVYPKRRIAFIALLSSIKHRIGTTNRIYHWLTCNRLVLLSRKRSDLHEALLNSKLLKGLNIPFKKNENLSDYYGFSNVPILNEAYESLLSKDKFNLIIHPKSRGHGKEWSLENYSKLIQQIDKSRFKIFISGSLTEKTLLKTWIDQHQGTVTDLTGLFNLNQFIAFISRSNGLLATGTGPLHIAAALGIHALGLFPSTRPIHAGRWAPKGKKAEYLDCINSDMDSIETTTVISRIYNWV
ncbi:glycosyltransferase family 9 protein [Arcticibacter eurypsychrophilus]|uniref:glycosyltransferase family 9 protein n=1 Tax=Arcticibacter eurypsychrophilus TaxID=1434752 RepID=UPI00084CECE4|nr:glycosyltransferase family 9 protein [Arcticibacter eurypsychrophilus]